MADKASNLKVSRNLLLLPTLATNESFASIKETFNPAIQDSIRKSTAKNKGTARLVLDVVCHYPSDQQWGFEATLRRLGLIYRLLVSSETNLESYAAEADTVDCRVCFFHNTRTVKQGRPGSVMHTFPTLEDLASPSLEWDTVFVPQSEVYEELLQHFLSIRNSSTPASTHSVEIQRVPLGPGAEIQHALLRRGNDEDRSTWPRHRSVAVGGTFDHLHLGHKLLLSATVLALGPSPNGPRSDQRLTVGITGDALLKQKKYAEELEDWDTRQASVRSFLLDFLSLLSSQNRTIPSDKPSTGDSTGRKRFDYLASGMEILYAEIFDPFGPTITDPDIDALIISAETRSGGQAVNERREQQGWRSLEVCEIHVLDAGGEEDARDPEDFSQKISSTEIRSRIHQRAASARAPPSTG